MISRIISATTVRCKLHSQRVRCTIESDELPNSKLTQFASFQAYGGVQCEYHAGENDCSCRCYSIRKQFLDFFFCQKILTEFINSEKYVREKNYDSYRFAFFTFSLSSFLLIQNDTHKIMVCCRSCTLSKHSPFHGAGSRDHSRLSVVRRSKHSREE